MNILVTGGAGFIGSHTCVELLQAGQEVIIADDFSNSGPHALEAIAQITGKTPAFYQIDVADYEALRQVFARHPIDGAIHFAGYKAVGESVRVPLSYYRNNLCTALNLARVMEECGVFRLVFSSSATVYGLNNPIPYKEEYPTGAVNPYGRTKVMIEQMLCDLAAADDRWSIALLRYFNPIGAHPSGLLGEAPNGIPNNLLPYIQQVAGGSCPTSTCSGMTTTPPTAPACGTTSTWWIWPQATLPPWIILWDTPGCRQSTLAPGGAAVCWRYCTPMKRPAENPCPTG